MNFVKTTTGRKRHAPRISCIETAHVLTHDRRAKEPAHASRIFYSCVGIARSYRVLLLYVAKPIFATSYGSCFW